MLSVSLQSTYPLSGSGKNLGHINDYVTRIKSTFDLIPLDKVDQVIDVLHEARMRGQQIFIMGNGGSASTASHFVCDLAKSTRQVGWPSFKVIGLTDNMAILTAYGNDEGYETVFEHQLANLVQPNDMVVAISASGNSANVLRAVAHANQVGAKTIGFTGFEGGKLAKMVWLNVHIPSKDIQQVEDVHMALEHMICSGLSKLAEPLEFIKPQTEIRSSGLQNNLTGSGQTAFSPRVVDYMSQNALVQFNDVIKELAQNLNLHDMLNRILSLTLQVVGAKSGSIIVLDESGEQVIDGAIAYSGQVKPGLKDQLEEMVDRGLAGWVVENRQPALIPDTSSDDRWLPRPWSDAESESRSAVSVPLMSHERVVGVVTLVRPQIDRFNLQDLALLTAITVALSYSIPTK